MNSWLATCRSLPLGDVVKKRDSGQDCKRAPIDGHAPLGILDRSRFTAFFHTKISPRLRTRIFWCVRIVLTLAGILFVSARIYDLGIANVIGEVPRQWLFYVVLISNYFVLPAFEWSIYHRLLGLRISEFGLLLRKRALNEAVFDYSGEVDFYMPLRHRTGAGSLIRDVNILSGVVSNGATIVLLAGLLVARSVGFFENISNDLTLPMSVACGVAIATLTCVAVLHRRLLSVDRAARVYVLRQHGLRLVINLVLQIVQWSVALPAIALGNWILFAVVWLLATRIPFVPNRDVLLAMLGLSLGGLIAAPQPVVAAMFAIGAIIPLALHMLILTITILVPLVDARLHRRGSSL